MSDTEDTTVLLVLQPNASETFPSQNEHPQDVPNNEISNQTATVQPEVTNGREKRFPNLIVLLAASTAALGGVLFGYDIGIISDAMLHLKTEFGLTCSEQEMVVSFMLIGAFVSASVGGPIIDYIGSRWAIILNAFLFIIGAFILVFSPGYSVLLCGRFVIGFAVALSAVSECIYISEISQPHNRGMLVTFNEVGITLGFLLAYVAGYLFVDQESGWRFMFGLSVIPASVQGIAMFFLPNTPSYLVRHRKEPEAEQVIVKLHNIDNNQVVRQEITNIRLSLEETRHQSCWSLCSGNDNVGSSMLIAVGLVVSQQFTGQPNVLSYAPTIFEKVGFCGENASTLATVGLGVIKFLSTIVSLCLIDRLGRRKSLLLGTILMLASLVILSIFAFYQNEESGHHSDCSEPPVMSNATVPACSENVTGSFRFVALGALMSYVAAYSFGFGPVTWLLLSEIFPTTIKGKAVAVSSSLNWASNFFISATFLQFVNVFTLGGVFIFYSVLCLFAVVFIFATVPETKNKALHKITQELKSTTFHSRFVGHLRTLPGMKKSTWLVKRTGRYQQLSQNKPNESCALEETTA